MKMTFEEIKKKFAPSLLLFILLISCLISFMLIFHYQKPNYELIDKSYSEKMLSIKPKYEQVFLFITNKTERGATVLFLNSQYYSNLQPRLNPYIRSLYLKYTNDQNLLDYIKQEHINYIIIIAGPHHLASDTYLFSRIELYSQIYLLQVNRTRL